MNIMKLMGALGNLSKVKGEIETITSELADLEFEGSAGGGMVTAKVNGASQVLALSIDPKLVDDNEREMIEELTIAAINDAASKAKKLSAEHFQKRLAEKLDLGDISGFFPK